MQPGDSTLADAEKELMRSRLDGSLVKSKARILVDLRGIPMLDDILRDPNQNLGARMDALKTLIRLGDLEPKAAAAPTGPAFSISINVPAGGQAPGTNTPLNVTPQAETLTLTLTPAQTPEQLADTADELPPKPPGFKMPDFVLTNDLAGPHQPAALAVLKR